MPRLEFFVVSKSVSVDASTNQISVFEILEELHISDFPAIFPSCVATTLWCREEGDENEDFQGRLVITTPSGEIKNIRLNFRVTAARHRLFHRVEGIPLTEAGILRFELILNEEHAAGHIVDVHHSGPLDTTGSTVVPS